MMAKVKKNGSLSNIEICQFGPGKYKPAKDTLDFVITDFKFHSQIANNPKSLPQNILSTYSGARPKRTFINGGLVAKENGEVEMGFGLDQDEVSHLLKKANKKRLRIILPEDGVSIFLGPDAIEKMKSLEKKKKTLKK